MKVPILALPVVVLSLGVIGLPAQSATPAAPAVSRVHQLEIEDQSENPGNISPEDYYRHGDARRAEIRKLLDYCGLPFDEACLRFYETERAVRTASSEQVRQPIYREAVEHWRNFEPYLAPLCAALGTALTECPF